MAKLTDKVENALNEIRILVLGLQILIGFAFRGFFEPGFQKMARYAQLLHLWELGLILLALGVMMVPVSYHRIVLHGRTTAELHRIATATVSSGLLPFAVGMALSLFLGGTWIMPATQAALFSGFILAVALFFWYGLELSLRRRKHGNLHLHATIDPLREVDMSHEEPTDLTTKVKQVLIECRVVLPGAQALLGFQLIILWMDAFARIPQLWKWIHLASLTAIAVCTILLIAPAAYHRIVEQGEDSDALQEFTGRMLLAALVFLAPGVCGDFYVVARITGISTTISAALATALLLFFYGAWFGYAYWKRKQAADPALAGSRLRPSRAA